MNTLSIFVYPGGVYTHVIRTIESIFDHTDLDELNKIYIISEEPLCEEIKSIKSIDTVISNDIISSLNEKISNCGSDYAVIILGDVKVLSGHNWWKSQEEIYSIPEYELDTYLWQSKGKLKSAAEFINMSLLKDFNAGNYGSTCSDNVIVVRVERFKQLGGFDGRYKDNIFTELCLRHCVESGASELKYNEGRIACRPVVQNNNKNKVNSLIAYNYFRKHYEIFKIITNSDYPKDYTYEQVGYNTDQFAKHNFDLKMYDLHATARGKKVAVVGPGASLDNICIDWLHDFDVIIGVDYVASLLECDYCLTERSDIASYIYNNGNYSQNQIILPYRLEDRVSGTYTSSDFFVGSIRYSKSNNYMSVFPPFIDGFVESVATHFAMFLRPDSITLFGVDNQIVGESSHTNKIDFYNGGKVWLDSEGTLNLFKQREAELKILKGMCQSMGISLLRLSYA